MTDLQALARQVRARVVEMSHAGEAAHLASALSCVDILVAAYFAVLDVDPARPDAPGRDRFIFSKGHAVAALYATLAYRGFFPLAELAQYNRAGARLPEHPAPRCVPGLELATGSLGHGLPQGLGMALGLRLQGLGSPPKRGGGRVFVLLSDGECNEGTVWEAALLAPAQKLGGLMAIVDANGWQATDRTASILALEPLAAKWEAFGWRVREVDGHDSQALVEALSDFHPERPSAVIARTTKGKGVSFMEDDNNWHYRIPNAAEVAAARAELEPS